MAVACSILVSLDRLLHVVKFLKASTRDGWLKMTSPPSSRLPPMSVLDCKDYALHYPKVLDDSTDRMTRELVDDKLMEWLERGLDIEVLRRTNRAGYKAGALKEGLQRLQDFDFVAIFDADFKPDSAFLMKTIHHLMLDLHLGFVQTRWTFTNADESYLTKAQEISLNYHCKCEQYAHFSSGTFFNFNGTAGVWRVRTIMDIGGWNSRTTVEDMDLSLRAYLAGWKGMYLRDVTCLNELPASFFAYRKQQHRWTCGPVQLWRKAAVDIWASSLPLHSKLDLILCYFGIWKVATHWVSMGFFCGLVPLSVFTPEVSVPLWALVHIPVLVTLTTVAFTPRGWMHCIHYVLFENAMGLVRLGAVIAGTLDTKRASEWVVTTKLGASHRRPGTAAPLPQVRTCRFYAGEMAMSVFVLTAAFYGMISMHRLTFSFFLILQGLAFLAFGLNMVDCGNLLGQRLRPARPAAKKVTFTDDGLVATHPVDRTFTL
ncbi:hypothetical protein WJX82_003810 [Trebouxia sp. C0006]